jgi:hypothetical protein
MEKTQNTPPTIERRKFLKKAIAVTWMTPVIMTIASEHAVAQTPACGTGNPCLVTTPCPASKPKCCRTSGNNCGCFVSVTGQTRCTPPV